MFWDVLVSLCNENKTSPSSVCKELGLSNSASVRWKKGTIPQDRTLQRIADFFDVTVDYLLGKEEKPAVANGEVIFLGGASVRMIPLYESVSAGFGALAVNSVVDYVPTVITSETEAQQTIAIRVHGDSMFPKIEDGDIVIVHKQESIDSGALGVVIIDGDEGYVKRVEYGDDWICLHSINPMYPVMKFKNEEVLRVQVVGRVTKIIKEV